MPLPVVSDAHPAQQATVLLNANVGFLAINTVDSGNGVSLRQIASYMSLMASFASIMLGLVFVGYNRTESRNSVFAAVCLSYSGLLDASADALNNDRPNSLLLCSMKSTGWKRWLSYTVFRMRS